MSEYAESPQAGWMPKDGAMRMGYDPDGTDLPYLSDPNKSVHTSEAPVDSFTRTPEEMAALRAEAARANEEAKNHTRTPDGVDLIGQERRRQIAQEGWTPEHDQHHTKGELVAAAKMYAEEARFQAAYPDFEWDLAKSLEPDDHGCASPWPWEARWWKPSGDPVRNLVKAGALIAAEIDRLLAARGPSGPLLPAPEFDHGD